MSEIASPYDNATTESQKLAVERSINWGMSVMKVEFGISEFKKFDDRFLYQVGKMYREIESLRNLLKSYRSFSGHTGVNDGMSTNMMQNPTFAPSCPVVEDLEKNLDNRSRLVNLDLNPAMIRKDEKSAPQTYHKANAGIISHNAGIKSVESKKKTKIRRS